MHNGSVGGFREIVRKLRSRLSDDAYDQIQGSTDSEHIFALFSDYFESEEEKDPLQRMVAALTRAIRHLQSTKKELGIREPCWLNLAVADGRRAVVSRFCSGDPEKAHSLYVHAGGSFVCEDGVCRMRSSEGGSRAVMVASEPLTKDPGWQRVAPNHFVVVDDSLRVEQIPVEL
jgi:predicted glutamine amidotransferase